MYLVVACFLQVCSLLNVFRFIDVVYPKLNSGRFFSRVHRAKFDRLTHTLFLFLPLTVHRASNMARIFTSCVVIFALTYIRCDDSRNSRSSTLKTDLSKFKCSTSNQEIDVYKRGDGVADCADHSDEDANRTGNQTILYFVWLDRNARKTYLKGIYVNSSARGEFQAEIPTCSDPGWKILYADRSHIHLRCYLNYEFQIMSVTRDGQSKIFHNFTLSQGNVDNLLGFITNSSTGSPIAYFKFKNDSSTLIKVCSENDRIVEYCSNLKYNLAKKPDYLVFSPKNNGTLFWLEKERPYETSIVKYSMNTSSASNIGPKLKQANHLTKDAATNHLYVQVITGDFEDWIQSYDFNGEYSNKVKEIKDEEKKQFAVHNGIMYWLKDTDSMFFCNASRADCSKTQKPLELGLNSTTKYDINTIYIYDYETNLEENIQFGSSIFSRGNTLVIYIIIGGVAITLLFIALAYVLGKKKGERTQSMDIHDDILTGTLRRKPAYCNEESLLTKGNDAAERIGS